MPRDRGSHDGEGGHHRPIMIWMVLHGRIIKRFFGGPLPYLSIALFIYLIRYNPSNDAFFFGCLHHLVCLFAKSMLYPHMYARFPEDEENRERSNIIDDVHSPYSSAVYSTILPSIEVRTISLAFS